MRSNEHVIVSYIEEEFEKLIQEKNSWGKNELAIVMAKAIRKAWERMFDNLVS